MKKRKEIQARCYREGVGVLAGVMTLTEWADVLGVDYPNVYHAYKKGRATKGENGGRYRFEAVEPGEEDYKESLSEANERARGEGKSYGQMQAEKYLQEHPIIPPREEPEEPEEQEEEMEPILEDETMEDLEYRTIMTMGEFVEAYVGEATFDLYIREEKDIPVCSIPSGSPVLPIFSELAVTGFMIEPWTSDTMRIYVEMEDPE